MPAFGQFVTDLLNLGSQPAGQDSETMVKQAINRSYRKLQRLCDNLNAGREFSFASVANISQYGLPLHVARIQTIIDQSNNKELKEISASEYNNAYPDHTDTGTPDWYYVFGGFGVEKQPSSASTLAFVSDDSDDDATMRVTGFNASNVMITETITLNGTSSVTTTASFLTVERIIKAKTSAQTLDGNITVTGGSNTLSVIPYWVDSPEYIWIELHRVPSAVITYTVRADMYKLPLVYSFDWPDVPEDYQDYILYDAGSEVLGPFGKPDTAATFSIKARESEKAFRADNNNRPNQVLIFQDIQMGDSLLPRRPLINNIDII